MERERYRFSLDSTLDGCDLFSSVIVLELLAFLFFLLFSSPPCPLSSASTSLSASSSPVSLSVFLSVSHHSLIHLWYPTHSIFLREGQALFGVRVMDFSSSSSIFTITKCTGNYACKRLCVFRVGV